MERSGSTAVGKTLYVGWEEVCVSSEKGRREMHYNLKRMDGGSDLAVVGKEKSLRHMSYQYAFKDWPSLSVSNSSSLLKLRSRRDVIDWLSSIVPDFRPHQSIRPVCGYLEREEPDMNDKDMRKNLCRPATESVWLGASWMSRKKRKHYASFCRNGFKISVHDFVYVLAEEGKRLVAHLNDMYEDSRGNKMVVVRWFHKIDEVGIVLPHNYNDREIFFSLCLQTLSIECIDGVATVLSPHHYKKFMNEARHTKLEPFVCHRQFDDDIKSFDITQVKGYWKQEILKFLSVCASKPQPPGNYPKAEGNLGDANGIRPTKRLRWSGESDCNSNLSSFERNIERGSAKGCISGSLPGKSDVSDKHVLNLAIGSEVEVLSQDSGIRGCWFRALITKKHKNKVKVQYKDIKDAADEAKNLEEWVSTSKLAAPDELGIRIYGRSVVRPSLSLNSAKVSWVINVGAIVDVWWHDGWWEGIVVKRESEDRLHVYFPGEKQEHIFGCSDLRHSQEWVENGWKDMKERPDLVLSLSTLVKNPTVVEFKPMETIIFDSRNLHGMLHEDKSHTDEIRSGAQNCNIGDKLKESEMVHDLSKDDFLSQLRWKSSGKRRHGRSPVHKVNFGVDLRARTSEKFLIPSLKADRDNCKYIGDSLFGSSVVSALTSLVMSR